MSKYILLIDDDRDDRDIFMEAIAEINNDFRCETAEDGEKGIAMLKSSLVKPDIIFLDLNMPRLNGKECLVEIRKIDSLRNVPVIIYTTSSSGSEKETLRKLGASKFVTKPSTFGDLCNLLSGVIYEGSTAAVESNAV